MATPIETIDTAGADFAVKYGLDQASTQAFLQSLTTAVETAFNSIDGDIAAKDLATQAALADTVAQINAVKNDLTQVQAAILGNIDAAVEMLRNDPRFADAFNKAIIDIDGQSYTLDSVSTAFFNRPVIVEVTRTYDDATGRVSAHIVKTDDGVSSTFAADYVEIPGVDGAKDSVKVTLSCVNWQGAPASFELNYDVKLTSFSITSKYFNFVSSLKAHLATKTVWLPVDLTSKFVPAVRIVAEPDPA